MKVYIIYLYEVISYEKEKMTFLTVVTPNLILYTFFAIESIP